jgi:hypothetical protein
MLHRLATLPLLLLALLLSVAPAAAQRAPTPEGGPCAPGAPGGPLACYRGALALATDSARVWRARGRPADAARAEREAAERFRSACEARVAAACSARARMLESGLGGRLDQAGAVELFQRACHLEPRACNDLAYSYAWGVGVAKDEALASRLYLRACEAGSPSACYRYAVPSEEKLGERSWAARLRDFAGRACRAGSDMGCYNQTAALETALNADSARLSAAEFRSRRAVVVAEREALCARQNRFACTRLGDMYSYGQLRTPPDTAAALRFYALGCPTGNPARDGDACSEMGDIVLFRAATRADSLRALGLYRSGCEVVESVACANAGWLGGVLDGSMTRDERISALRTACDGGNAVGCNTLAVIFDDEIRDALSARATYRRACELGSEYGCRNLGNMVEGAERRTAFDRSCTLGLAFGCESLGAELRRAGRPDSAAAAYRRGCEADARVCVGLATALVEAGDTAAALGAYERGCTGTRAGSYACGDLERVAALRAGNVDAMRSSCKAGRTAFCLAAADAYLHSGRVREAGVVAMLGCTQDRALCHSLAGRFEGQERTEMEGRLRRRACTGGEYVCGWLGQWLIESDSADAGREVLVRLCQANPDSCREFVQRVRDHRDYQQSACLRATGWPTCDLAVPERPERLEIALEMERIVCQAKGPADASCADLAARLSEIHPATADSLYRAACDAGNQTACARAGAAVESGSAAEGLLARACESGAVEGCVRWGGALAARGESGGAMNAWDRACTLGSSAGCRLLGDAAAGDPARALSAWRRGCRNGSGMACLRAADLLEATPTPDGRRDAARAREAACLLNPELCVAERR